VFIAALELADGVGHLLDELVHFQHAAKAVYEAKSVSPVLLRQHEVFGDVDGVQGVIVGVEVAQQVWRWLGIGHSRSFRSQELRDCCPIPQAARGHDVRTCRAVTEGAR